MDFQYCSYYEKNGILRVYLDFGDINKTTPKDDYPMPIADILVNLAFGHEVLSFMDSYSGYNQIFITEDDVSKTAFQCPGEIGTFEWVVLSFGLKNTGVTYNRAMHTIFHDKIRKWMEVYIDDIVIKSTYDDHLEYLKSFERIRSH